jgi:hypothetical protein
MLIGIDSTDADIDATHAETVAEAKPQFTCAVRR